MPHLMSSGKFQIKTTLKYPPHPIEWPKSKTLTTINAGEGMEQQELLFIAGENTKQHSLKGSLAVSHKLNILLPYDPAISLIDIYPKKFKNYVHAKTDIYSSFIHKSQTWKQPKRPSTDE